MLHPTGERYREQGYLKTICFNRAGLPAYEYLSACLPPACLSWNHTRRRNLARGAPSRCARTAFRAAAPIRLWPAITDRQPLGVHSRPLAPSTQCCSSASGSRDATAAHFASTTPPAALVVTHIPVAICFTSAADLSMPGTSHCCAAFFSSHAARASPAQGGRNQSCHC
jgi:hypothetical protein